MRLIDADMLIDTITYSASLGGIWGGLLTAIKTAFIHLVKEMPTAKEEPHWIPCSERMPDKPCRCLTTNEAWGAFEVDWNVWCEEGGEQGWLCPNERPIAWMPLPEPWKGEE